LGGPDTERVEKLRERANLPVLRGADQVPGAWRPAGDAQVRQPVGGLAGRRRERAARPLPPRRRGVPADDLLQDILPRPGDRPRLLRPEGLHPCAQAGGRRHGAQQEPQRDAEGTLQHSTRCVPMRSIP
ncbi:hypothetical protein DIPPA_20728, partial [Diplonema papillatum]